MRRAIASVVILAFAGLLSTSLLAVFSGSTLSGHAMVNPIGNYPYFIAY